VAGKARRDAKRISPAAAAAVVHRGRVAWYGGGGRWGRAIDGSQGGRKDRDRDRDRPGGDHAWRGVAWRRVGRSCPRDHAWVLYGFGRLSSFPLPPWVDRWFGGSAATAAVATPACSTSQAGSCSAIQAASQGGRGIIIHGEILLAVMRRDSVSISGWIRSAAQHTLSAG
jgi:hypothetical protein